MKSILVIGLGRFGRHLCQKFMSLNNEVMIVDRDEAAVTALASEVTSAQIADCTDESVLRTLGVQNFDLCFVCIGTDFQSSLLITVMLKDLGARRVISKASRDIHAKFLLRNGADEVIYPERDTAERIAVRASANNVFDYIELTPEYSIYEIPPMEAWLGKTIAQCNVRTKYHISILATKQNGVTSLLPPADHLFVPSEHLMVIGRHEDIQRVLKRI